MTICGSHPAADCGLGGPGMRSAIVNRNGGLQKGGLLEFVEPELILERMEDCVNPDLLDLREPEDLGYILRTLIILAVPVMYNGLRPALTGRQKTAGARITNCAAGHGRKARFRTAEIKELSVWKK